MILRARERNAKINTSKGKQNKKHKHKTEVEKMSENKPKRNKFKALCIIETLIIAALSGGLIWNSFLKDKFDENGKTVPVNGGSVSEVRTRPVIEKEETFYQLDGKKILMQNSVYGEVFMPVFADVPACSLDMNSLVTRNGYAFYKENEEITSIAGIDVSEHQGDIDWNAVKNAGIE